MLSEERHRAHPPPHSFPTRRSSDLSTLLDDGRDQQVPAPQVLVPARDRLGIVGIMQPQRTQDGHACGGTFPHGAVRSEEHTSELQSQSNLVCRLLLEKKIADAPFVS